RTNPKSACRRFASASISERVRATAPAPSKPMIQPRTSGPNMEGDSVRVAALPMQDKAHPWKTHEAGDHRLRQVAESPPLTQPMQTSPGVAAPTQTDAGGGAPGAEGEARSPATASDEAEGQGRGAATHERTTNDPGRTNPAKPRDPK